MRSNPFRSLRLVRWFFLTALLGVGLQFVAAQTPSQTPSQTPTAAADNNDEPPPPTRNLNASPTENAQEAWVMLTTSLNDVKHPEHRIQALAALGIMGDNPRSIKLIVDTMNDKDIDIKTAAILAAGQTKARRVIPALRRMLDDQEPEIAFAAATTLWKMKDHSGETVLMAVADGNRKANSGLVNGTMHSMNKELHDPADMARLGALQGASMLLGPFGIGITAFEYVKKNGGNSARAIAIDDLAQTHSPALRSELLGVLGDKDVAVRVAAAKALAEYHDPEVGAKLADLLADPKLPARLTAAAAFLKSSGTDARSHTHAPARPVH